MPENYFMFTDIALAKSTADHRLEVETGQVEEELTEHDADEDDDS